MHWGRPIWFLVAALLATSTADAATCTQEVPCRLDAVVTPQGLDASAASPGLGPFVLVVQDQANRTTDVGIDGVVGLTVPANGTAQSERFTFPGAGMYVLRESAGNSTAHIEVVLPAKPSDDGPSATEILAVTLPLLVGCVLLALASLVLRKGGAHLHTRLFGTLFLLSGIKSIGEGLVAPYSKADGSVGQVADVLHASSPLFPDAVAWELVGQVCALVMLPLLFLFCTCFPKPTGWMVDRPAAVAAVVFVPSLLIGALLFTAKEDLSLAPGALSAFNVIDVVVGFNLLAAGMTAIAFFLLWRTHRRSPDHIERKQALYVVLGFLPSFLVTWVIATTLTGFNAGVVPLQTFLDLNNAVVRFISPLLEVVAAGLVAFAILKYNILGVDPKFRVGVKSVVVGFVFVVVFLLTQAIENIVLQGKVFAFAGEYGSFLLSGTTSLLLFKPIERFSGKVSDKLLPRPAEGDATLARSVEVYHAQCTYVLRDAHVSERELAFLHNLRTQLGLSDAQARAIEEKVERILKVDAPQTGATAGTAITHVAKAHEEVAGAEPHVERASPLPDGSPATDAAKPTDASARPTPPSPPPPPPT